MPRYFFDMNEGAKLFRDHEGIDLSDNNAAREEAARALVDIVRECPVGDLDKTDIKMWVRAEDGSPLLELTASFGVKPAASIPLAPFLLKRTLEPAPVTIGWRWRPAGKTAVESRKG